MDLVPHHVTVPAGAPTEGLPVPLPRPAPGTAKWWVVAAVGCLLGTALAIWWGLASTLGQVTWTDLGYAHVTDRIISVTYDVHRPTDRDVSCVVRALDNHHGTVGAVTVTIPAGGEASVHRVTVVKTTTKAVTGEVQTCSVLPAGER
jgi:hypothetical protein